MADLLCVMLRRGGYAATSTSTIGTAAAGVWRWRTATRTVTNPASRIWPGISKDELEPAGGGGVEGAVGGVHGRVGEGPRRELIPGHRRGDGAHDRDSERAPELPTDVQQGRGQS